jgi:hypothetical protein
LKPARREIEAFGRLRKEIEDVRPGRSQRGVLADAVGRGRRTVRAAQAQMQKALSRTSRNQRGKTPAQGTRLPRLFGRFLDDPPIHIRPNGSRKCGCTSTNPMGSSRYGGCERTNFIFWHHEILRRIRQKSTDKGLRFSLDMAGKSGPAGQFPLRRRRRRWAKCPRLGGMLASDRRGARRRVGESGPWRTD